MDTSSSKNPLVDASNFQALKPNLTFKGILGWGVEEGIPPRTARQEKREYDA